MKQILVFFFAGLAVASAVINPVNIIVDVFKNEPSPNQTILNSLIDVCVIVIKDMVRTNAFEQNFNPLNLPNSTIPVPFGYLTLSEVKLFGFDTIYRNGDATAIYDDAAIHAQLGFGYNQLTINSKYAFQTLFLKSNGALTATIDNVLVNIHLHIDRRTFYVSMESCDFVNNSGMNIKLQGNNAVTAALNLSLNLLINFFKDQAINFIAPLAKGTIGQLVVDANRP